MSSRGGLNLPHGHAAEPHACGLQLSRCRAWLCCWLGLCLLGLSGCSSWLPELVPFGSVNAPDQFRSINGLGVHRRMWESAGVKVLTPLKLSPRLDTVDTIVLVGQSFSPPGRAARDWLERVAG